MKRVSLDIAVALLGFRPRFLSFGYTSGRRGEMFSQESLRDSELPQISCSERRQMGYGGFSVAAMEFKFRIPVRR